MSMKRSLIIYTLHNVFYFNVGRICQSCLKGYVLLNTSMYVRESRGRNMNQPRCLSYISRFYTNCWTKYSASLSLFNFVSFTRVTTHIIQDWNSLNSIIVPNNKLWNTYCIFFGYCVSRLCKCCKYSLPLRQDKWVYVFTGLSY